MGAKRAENLVCRSVAVSGVKKNWLERDWEVVEQGTEWGAGVAETGLSDERKFCHSCSAHMLCSPWCGPWATHPGHITGST